MRNYFRPGQWMFIRVQSQLLRTRCRASRQRKILTGGADFQNQLKLFPGGPVRLFNPDEAARIYYASNPEITVEAANLWAANAVPAQVVQCIDAGENVAVETVLSSDNAHMAFEIGAASFAFGAA
jgi:hypothetical protein